MGNPADRMSGFLFQEGTSGVDEQTACSPDLLLARKNRRRCSARPCPDAQALDSR